MPFPHPDIPPPHFQLQSAVTRRARYQYRKLDVFHGMNSLCLALYHSRFPLRTFFTVNCRAGSGCVLILVGWIRIRIQEGKKKPTKIEKNDVFDVLWRQLKTSPC
jgi:hypothetical protein